SMDTKGVDCSERKRPPQRDTTRPFVSLPERFPGQAKKDGNCLPLRLYPDVLRSRLAEVKSGPRCFRAGDEPTHVWARCGGDLLWIILDNQHP
ncbi:hypothetical protein HMPREF0083_05572, partial [Aneurinibacillus aneurinilyticus ATCC 12856]